MKISIIVAVAENGVIGRDNELPWRLSADLRRFKATTMGHHLLMGRKTFESIGRPLPGREMIVVSRTTTEFPSGIHRAATIDEGLEQARARGEDELFVAGGASIYRETLPMCNRVYLTRVLAHVDGDVTFPESDFSTWRLVSSEDIAADDDNEHATTFSIYEQATR